MRLPLLCLVLCSALSLAVCPPANYAQAQQSAAADKEMEEVQHYLLTMDKMNRFAATFNDLSAYAKQHPESAHMLEGESNESLSAAEHRIASKPVVVDILAKHSFSPREFVILGFALFQAAFAETMAQQNGVDPAKMAAEAHVNPANMTFVTQHKAELEAIMAKMKESAPKESSDN